MGTEAEELNDRQQWNEIINASWLGKLLYDLVNNYGLEDQVKKEMAVQILVQIDASMERLAVVLGEDENPDEA